MFTFRIDRMERGGSKTNLILYHFVSCLGSSSAEPGVIFGRLLKKVNLYTCTRLKCRLIIVTSHLRSDYGSR